MKKDFISLTLFMVGSELFAIDKEDKDLEMERAIFHADWHKVRKLIRSGYDVNIVSCGDKLPINAAIVHLNVLMILKSKLTDMIRKENNYKQISAIWQDNLDPSLDRIEEKLLNLSEIGIELLDNGSKIEKDLSKKLEQITCYLCPKKEVCLLCPQQKKQPSFCLALHELTRRYNLRLAEQERQKLENIEKTEKN